jgi:hypothetical protein
MIKNSEQPINPMPYQNQDGTIQHDVYRGLTKREHFAVAAMQGILGNSSDAEISEYAVFQTLGLPAETKYSFIDHYPKYAAKMSLIYADALLAELSK